MMAVIVLVLVLVVILVVESFEITSGAASAMIVSLSGP